MKDSDYHADREYARRFEKTLEGWYASQPFITHFWREPDHTPRQISGVDVNFINGSYDRVWSIDEKISKSAKRTGNMLFETWQHDGSDGGKPKLGWGATAKADVIVYCGDDPDTRTLEVWWIELDGLRHFAQFLPEREWTFKYDGYVRCTRGKLIGLQYLVDLGVARGPYVVPYGEDVP